MSEDMPRVLVVEDEARLRDLLLEQLPGMGYIGVEAASAEAAQRIIKQRPPDVVMLDLNLPQMDGMTFLRQLRQDWPRLPVIIMTAFGDLETAKRAIEFEVTAFLTKPCRLGEIDEALAKARRKLLEQKAVHRQPDRKGDMPPRAPEAAAAARPNEPSTSLPTLAELERKAIIEALRRHGGNRSAAASDLGISRRTLYNRLDEYQRLGLWPDE